MASDDTSAGPGKPAQAARGQPFDTGVAHVARVYNYWLGGTDNFPADQAAAQAAMAAYPDIVHSARANRAFLRRVVTYLTGQAGIRQFLDIGTGIPTANNTHQVAQAAEPACRVVYVDKDPVVHAHATALLAGSPQGVTSYLNADLRDTEQILARAAGTLDLGRPVAVMLMAILQHIGPEDDPLQVVGNLVAAVPSGSYLAISHPASDLSAAQMGEMASRLNQLMAEKVTFRSRDEVARFFDGLELVPPGLSRVQVWRPDTEEERTSPAALWGGVARKP